MEANSGEIHTCKEKREHLGMMRAAQVNAVAKSGRECNTSILQLLQQYLFSLHCCSCGGRWIEMMVMKEPDISAGDQRGGDDEYL